MPDFEQHKIVTRSCFTSLAMCFCFVAPFFCKKVARIKHICRFGAKFVATLAFAFKASSFTPLSAP